MFAPNFFYPYYDGLRVLSTSVVPGQYPTALGGHPYLLDDASGYHKHQSIALLRPQSDTSGIPGESSLNPEGTWRRAQDSWHKGAGQTYVDKPESDIARFRSSKGINVWTKWEMGLLNATKSARASVNTNLRMAVAGERLYCIDGTDLVYTTDVSIAVPVFTTVTGGPGVTPVSIASDGYNVLTAHGTGGVYRTTKISATTSQYVTSTVSIIAYVKDRIMAANGPSIYNVTSPYTSPAAPLPTPLFTHRNADFTWVGFADGQEFLYAAGYSGDKSLIYKTQVQAEGTALEVPTIAGELPDGEVIRAIQGYLGYIMLGTDLGVRFCAVDDAGNLVIGSLIPTPPVYAFEPQDRFVWFGWSNYDGSSTGLGRMDLSVFNATLTPAYASDLMVSGQGAVTSIVTFQARRVFSVGGSGFYAEDTVNKVASGTLDSGLFTFGTPDPKVAIFLDIRYKSISGTHIAYVAGSDGTFIAVGAHTSFSDTSQFNVPEVKSDALEIRHVLQRDPATPSLTPCITRHTLKATVNVDSGYRIYVPFLLTAREQLGQQERARDPLAELVYIKTLRADQTRVSYQEGESVYSVTVDDYDWRPHHMPERASKYDGTCFTTLRVLGVS